MSDYQCKCKIDVSWYKDSAVLESLLRRSCFFYVAVPLGVLAPVMFMFFAARSLGRSQEESQAYDQTAQTARLTAIVLDHHFHTAVERLESIAHRPSLHRDIAHENWRAVKEELRLNSSVYPEIAYLGVLSAQGGKLNAIHPLGSPAFRADFSQRDWYKAVTGNWTPYVSPVQPDSSPHSQVVGVAVPIFDDDGGHIAVLLAGQRLDPASSWLRELQPSSAVIIEVVDQQGHVLSSRAPQQPQQTSEALDASSKELVRRALAGENGAGVFLRQGKPAIVSYRPIPGLHWGVLAELPLERVHLPWNRFQSAVIPMAALLVVVVVIFALSTVRVTQAAEKRLREKLQEQSVQDPLTGTYNRRYLEELLKREIRRTERAGQPVGLLMIDVDYFKTINDIYGHDGGDFVLQDLAKVLQSHVRGEDVVCRFGGDEFCVVMPGANREAARLRAEMIRASVMIMPLAGSKIDPVTVSIGVAATGKTIAASAQLLKAADEALYQAKQNGRNQVSASLRGVANELPPPPGLMPPAAANTHFA